MFSFYGLRQSGEGADTDLLHDFCWPYAVFNFIYIHPFISNACCFILLQAPHNDLTFSKPSKQCPCVSCTEVFTDWNELGNHVAHDHTPSTLRPYLQHTCTACNGVFKTYYHAKAHWEDKLQTCARSEFNQACNHISQFRQFRDQYYRIYQGFSAVLRLFEAEIQTSLYGFFLLS